MTTGSQFELAGKRVLVTGASRGIGRALAIGLAGAGADLVVVARSEPDLETLVEEIRVLGRRAVAMPLDLSDLAAAEDCVHGAIEALGGLDVLVNNAAIDVERSVLLTDTDEFLRINTFNLGVPYAMARTVAPHFIEAGGGVIVNVASILGVVGVRDDSAYVTSKHGVVGLTRSLALEWARKRIRVNAVAPGFIRTEMTRATWEDERALKWALSRTPMGRVGEPEDMVGPVVFLCSDAASFVTGHTLIADGGWTAE